MSAYFDLAVFNSETGGENGSSGEPKLREKISYAILKKVIKYSIITSCTVYCLYLLWASVATYLLYDTSVSVNVRFMRELRKILPGITFCTNSL